MEEKKKPKKRGRKPKGGKIISSTLLNNDVQKEFQYNKQNVILHLRCNSAQLESNIFLSNVDYNPNIESVQAYNNNKNFCFLQKDKEDVLSSNDTFNNEISSSSTSSSASMSNMSSTNGPSEQDKKSELWEKLKELQKQMHHNHMNKHKSCCFYCTLPYKNYPIYIPLRKQNDMYEVYGSFCSTQCAASFIFREERDDARKWEQYALLNSIYSPIFNYKMDIVPAPNPYYTLQKYHGNLTDSEYRELLDYNHLLFVIEKPITRVSHNIFLDNNEVTIHGSCSNNDTKKYKLCRNDKKKTAVNIFNV